MITSGLPVGTVTRPGVIKKPKIVEIEKEVPKIIKKVIDVPEEVIVEKPVERIHETEVYYDRIVEVPREVIIPVDKEIIREERKEVVKHVEVPVIREIEVPVEKIRHVPKEILIEKEVKVPKYVDRVEDRVVIKPFKTNVVYNDIYQDIPVYRDVVREMPVYQEIPVYVDKYQDKKVEVPYYKEVEVPIYVDKIVEHKVPVDVITEVPVEYITEVPKPVYQDKYIDKPYDVPVIVDKEIPVPVDKKVERHIPVDRIVETEVEKRVNVDYPVVKTAHIYFNRITEKPKYDLYDVDIPQPVVVDVPVVVEQSVEKPFFTEEINEIEYPLNKAVPVPVVQNITLPVQRVKEDRQIIDRVVDVPLPQEIVKEIVHDVIVEKEIIVNKIITKRVPVPRYVDKYVDKIVEVQVRIERPQFVEVPSEEITPKPVDLVTTVQKLRVQGRSTPAPMNTLIRGQVLNPQQIRRFEESSRNLALIVEDNIKLKAELEPLLQTRNILLRDPNRVTPEMVESLRNQKISLESSVQGLEAECARLRGIISSEVQLQEVPRFDSSLVPVLMEQIRNIRSTNDYLKGIAQKGKFNEEVIQTGKEIVSTNIPPGMTGVYGNIIGRVGSRGSSVSYSGSSRSVSPGPITRTIHPTVQRISHGAPYPAREVRRTSPIPTVTRGPTRVTTGYPVASQVRTYSPGYSSSGSSRSSRSPSPTIYNAGGGVTRQYAQAPSVRTNQVFGSNDYQQQVDNILGSPAQTYGLDRSLSQKNAPLSTVSTQYPATLAQARLF